MDISDLIEKFNNGETDFIKYFSNVPTFLKFVDKRGLLDELDPDGKLSDDYQNDLVVFYYENDKEKFNKFVDKHLGDVEYINGTPHLVINSKGELAQLFCKNNRNGIDRDTVESILDGEHDNDGWSYHDLTDNIYQSVIEELNKENFLHLKNYILKHLEGIQVDINTELLESIAEQQGHPEYVIVDPSNIDQIVNDQETMDDLMDNDLDELKNELYSIYGNAYNSAYEDDLYENVWGKLDDYFIGNGEWDSRPHVYKKDTSIQKFIIPIHNFESNILDYLKLNNGYQSGTLEYWGSYLSILSEDWECLSVYPSDYPSSNKVDENINDMFTSYI